MREKKKSIYFLIIITLLIATYERNSIWGNEVALWEDVVKKSPNKARPHHNLGAAFAAIGQYDIAINNYNRSLELIKDRSDSYRIYNNRGNAYSQKGQFDLAIADYDKAIIIRPFFAEAYYNRGNARIEKGEFDSAIDDYKKVTLINPDFSEAYNNIGIAYFRKGQHDIAFENFKISCSMGNDMGCKNLSDLIR